MKWLALAALLILPLAASAQDDPGDGGAMVTVDYGEYELEVPANDPLSACIVRTVVGLDGPESHELIVYVRNLDGERTELGVYSTEATGPLRNATAGQCPGLEKP